MKAPRCVRAGVLALIAALTLGACVKDGGSADGGDRSLTLHVFAAASLSAPFDKLEQAFENTHPDVDVVMNFAGSQDLVAQMQAGAPADLFASANEEWMDKARTAGLISGDSPIFARNILEIAVAPGNPKEVKGLADVASRPDLVVVRCAPAVPCGALTDRVLESSGYKVQADTEQNSVTDTLGLVSAGEADAGFVYATDIQAASDTVEGVPFDEAQNFSTAYPIALTTQGSEGKANASAREFLQFVTGAEGQNVLEKAGFEPGE